MSDQLAVARFFRGERDIADKELRTAVIQAQAEGCSLRRIARATDISHVGIFHILQPDRPISVTFSGSSGEYKACHDRVRALRGVPQRCSRCSTSDPEKTYDWANLSGRYEDPDDYERMCRRCHRTFDNGGQPIMKNVSRQARAVSASVDLNDVLGASRRRADADRGLREAILRAREDGHTIRSVAAAAGVTHPTVLRIVRAASPDVGKP